MKRLLLVLMLAVVAVSLQSCGGLAAGIINRQIIESDKAETIEKRITKYAPLALSEEQKSETRLIYDEEITNLKENARKEKTKEISNKSSLNTFAYETYKSQVRFEKILDKAQLLQYRQMVLNHDVPGLNEKQAMKMKKNLKRKGYDVNF
ncbi:MAG: hypothetical protein Q8O62_10040 [Aequorivita sp.]|nr:hypothetical protein [Aequorivita sp.]